jgi:dimethylaniline monooxygenase (N-oxide forming)
MYEIKQLTIRLKPTKIIKFSSLFVLFLILVAYKTPHKKRVLIIGGGPSGLVAAKSALECGLEPFILEKGENIGGAWNPQNGLMWNSMLTNSSRYTTMFSDFPWQAGTADFPKHSEVYNYLIAYTAKFDLNKYIHFNSEVIHVKNSSNKWQVTWREDGKKQRQKFDFVIVATGMFSKPYLPTLKGMNEFKGKIIHSKDYKLPEAFENKRVIIVGGAFSGSQISTDVSKSASYVLNVISRPMYILQRYIKADPEGIHLPVDFTFYNREAQMKEQYLTLEEKNRQAHERYSRICYNQASICKFLAIDANTGTAPYITISDTYLQDIQSGKVEVTLNKIVALDKEGIVFNNGERQPADVIVFCTGYQLDLSFLDPAIQQALTFLPEDRLQPVVLHKHVFHPKLRNMAFVGLHRGAHWGVTELQSRWINMVFAGIIPMPSIKTMLEGVDNELVIRTQNPKPQFPHDSSIELLEDLGREIGAVPDMASLKQNDPHLYNKLMHTPIIPAHYRLAGFGNNPTVAKQIIDDLYQFMQETKQIEANNRSRIEVVQTVETIDIQKDF